MQSENQRTASSSRVNLHYAPKPKLLFLATLYSAFFLGWFTLGESQDIKQLMPDSRDDSQLWWDDGFPSIINDAKWHRILKTGHYWLVVDTEKITIPQMGSSKNALSDCDPAELRLQIKTRDKVFTCHKAQNWDKWYGPRLIESGHTFQHFDIRGLVFQSEDGEVLNCDTRLDLCAWPTQLGMSLFARPGFKTIPSGQKCWGRINGGFGINNATNFKLPKEKCTIPNHFTLSFWVFLPDDFASGKHTPWLVCSHQNELSQGQFGITLDRQGLPTVRFNSSGGRQGEKHFKSKEPLRLNRWNHVALSFDGRQIQLLTNEKLGVNESVVEERKAKNGDITFGGRGDGLAGFEFKGILDEILLVDRALSTNELQKISRHPEVNHVEQLNPVAHESFDPNGNDFLSPPRETWTNSQLIIEMKQGEKLIRSETTSESPKQWQNSSITFDPVTLTQIEKPDSIQLQATDVSNDSKCQVQYDDEYSCYRVDLDRVNAQFPVGTDKPSNNALERVRFRLFNRSNQDEKVKLLFAKTAVGLRQINGQAITGISAILRDSNGYPTGIPVQLSKNWHLSSKAGEHQGVWFHGLSQINLPANSETELELVIAYGHWGGLPAVSHAQLCLVGWGYNQLWDQSAIGAWGESICYNPEQILGDCTVTDVRPLMVNGSGQNPKWNWTNNVGGADFLRLFDIDGQRQPHAKMQTHYHKQGPCLSEVEYRGTLARNRIRHSTTTFLGRTSDLVRATFRIRMDVDEPIDFSRFVIFQTGADTYSYANDNKFAMGNSRELISEWTVNPRTQTAMPPIEMSGTNRWASLHDNTNRQKPEAKGAWANRGFVIREWQAKLGGKPASPWLIQHDGKIGERDVNTLDILSPPSITRLLPGDFVEATIEFLVIPQFQHDYYGPNQDLQKALGLHQNTWQMVQREANQGELSAVAIVGEINRTYPGIEIKAVNDKAKFQFTGGLGFVPVTFTHLSKHAPFRVAVDGVELDQSIHGNDFWQTNYHPETKSWSVTFNLPSNSDKATTVELIDQSN